MVDVDDVHASHLQHVGVSSVAELETYLADQPRTTTVERALLRAGLERLARPGASHARTVAGWPVSLALAAALACDGSLRRVLTSGSEILDYGRPASAAVVPQAIRDAVTLRDRGCRYPGCDRGIDWCELHHVVPRSHGGGHAVANCALVCARHHHVLHRPGWRAALLADGTLRVTDPGGRTRATRPPGPHPRAPDPFDHAA